MLLVVSLGVNIVFCLFSIYVQNLKISKNTYFNCTIMEISKNDLTFFVRMSVHPIFWSNRQNDQNAPSDQNLNQVVGFSNKLKSNPNPQF